MTKDDFFWWRADALCTQIGGELFFLGDGEPGKEAKQACAMCPVRDLCLAESLLMEEENGIWGGIGRDARRRLARQITPRRSALTVARDYIAKESRERQQAPRGGRLLPGGGRRDRLPPRPPRHPAERPAVEARRPGAA